MTHLGIIGRLLSKISGDALKLVAFGSGVGIEIGTADLEVALARVRPSRIEVLGRLTIHNFAERPAAEWGLEYSGFLKSKGAGRLSATVLLPREDTIVRQVSLPGVAKKDITAAIRYQLDSLHPYAADEVSWGWSAVGAGCALVGIARSLEIDDYIRLFNEAGVAVASFTFSAAVVHAAIRLNGHALGEGFVALSRTAAGGVEVYGESATRPVFSAEFDMAPQRAASLALAELRLPPDTVPQQLEAVLPKPAVNPVENDLSRNALPYATALAGACPWLVPAANVLPAEYRRSNSRVIFMPTIVLGALFLLLAGGTAAQSDYRKRQQVKKIEAEVAQNRPVAMRAAALDREIDRVRARTLLLDQFRDRTWADLEALDELTKIVEPPAWTSSVELTRDGARIIGEAPQATPLVQILDSSPLFENSVPDQITRAANGVGEMFQIHTSRENRK